MASHEVRYALGSVQYFVLYEYWSARASIYKNISDNRSQPANCLMIDPDLHSYRVMLTSDDDSIRAGNFGGDARHDGLATIGPEQIPVR